jgi:hypothetical protein
LAPRPETAAASRSTPSARRCTSCRCSRKRIGAAAAFSKCPLRVKRRHGTLKSVARSTMRELGPRPTLGELQRATPWVWLWCECCQHHAPLACAVPVIRWGPDAPSDKLRTAVRCTGCGGKVRPSSGQAGPATMSASIQHRGRNTDRAHAAGAWRVIDGPRRWEAARELAVIVCATPVRMVSKPAGFLCCNRDTRGRVVSWRSFIQPSILAHASLYWSSMTL